ncbi:hypothetical protein ACIQMV_19410 [Streptomyces sp. NPDC091412]|uniref:hypothetical protein n=1 Tax=Streptomyces sp. NPDC091412 TaxID=3366002 RepID=UPI00380474CA
MNDTTGTGPRRVQLAPARVDEIRGLVQQLAGRPDPAEAPRLLADARTALADLLTDRDDLVRANATAGEDLARWTGAIN